MLFTQLGFNRVYAQVSIAAVEEYEENLSAIFTTKGPDTLRLSILMDSLKDDDHELADVTLKYTHKAIDQTNKLKLTNWEAEFYNKLGWMYITLNKKDESEVAHEKSIKLFERAENVERQVKIMHTLIASYAINNAAEKALKLAYETIELCPLVDDESCLGITYFRMAKTMYNFDEDEKGIEFAKKAIPLLEKSQKVKELAACYTDFAKYGSYNYEESVRFMDKSLALLKKDTTTNPKDLIKTYLSRILMHQKFEKYDEAEIDINYLNDELKSEMSIRRQQNLAMTSGINKYNLEKYKESIAILKKSVTDQQASINPFIYYDYQYIQKGYEKLGQLDSAYQYHMILHALESDDRVHESRMKMKDVEAKYEAEKKELIITAQNKEIAKQKMVQWFALGGSILLGLLLLQTYRNAQQKRRANNQLIELANVKTRLYTNITHEFRTPLTVILGMASQVKNNPAEFLDTGTSLIQRNGERLLELINQMLDLSKLESGAMTMDYTQANIIDYIKYISNSVHSFAEGKNIDIHFYPEEEEVIMDYDQEKIKIILTNLFSNAIKFTPENGNIYIVTRQVKEGGTHKLKIMFKDTGIGIEEEKLPYVFDRFYQTDTGNTRAGEGTGIGLAVVQEYITLMGGEISVRSKLGIETEFTILLPVKNNASIKVKQMADDKKALLKSKMPGIASKAQNDIHLESKATVLLIEDSLDVATYIASCLDQDYNVIIGNNGKEGVEMALKYVPDVIITDIMMPLKDGFEVCQEVKAHHLTSHIPLIILTAKADFTSKLEGLKYGADAYLEKPFNKEELQTRLVNLLASRNKIQQHYLSITTSHQVINSPRTETPLPEDEFVKNLHQIVTDNISDTSFSVESFARIMAMSSSQFHRKVSGVTGLSPNKFIRHIKLSKAKVLLEESNQPISSIAYETGFNDPGYFSRVFKNEYEITPLEWRERRVK